uniref:Uncharacterized protein n=1 Tax=Cucumis melo TaxID=3656 RepID=A0A9I9E684_CUCME
MHISPLPLLSSSSKSPAAAALASLLSIKISGDNLPPSVKATTVTLVLRQASVRR